ncbi:Dbl-likey domain-containing protein [Gigaspora margarita]|uniref:Dbl-likey domain-containing protein n=1 Tax=Gigaspora margarita TaxID=4874 RepID=A0A8H4AS93_GIGMA|nr:Dbl-likey domain-containing protein [Gigaspora margarita]
MSRGDSGYYCSLNSPKSETDDKDKDSYDDLDDTSKDNESYIIMRSSMPYWSIEQQKNDGVGNNRYTFHTLPNYSTMGDDPVPPLPTTNHPLLPSLQRSPSYDISQIEMDDQQRSQTNSPVLNIPTSDSIDSIDSIKDEEQFVKAVRKKASLQSLRTSNPHLTSSANLLRNRRQITLIGLPSDLDSLPLSPLLSPRNGINVNDLVDSYCDEDEEPGPTPEEIAARNRKREAAVSEILNTERRYVDGLEKLVNIFLLPLREICQKTSQKNGLLSIKPIASLEDIAALFGNIEQLLILHKSLLKSLEDRYRTWSPDEKISDIFLQTAPFLKMYIIYLKSFPRAIATMERLNKNSKEFKKFLSSCQSKQELGGLTFNSFLSLPIQRIPRYKLLLEALLKHTDESHPDFIDLQKCVRQINIIADEVNEKMRDAENQQKVLEIQIKVENIPDIINPARRFIYSGELYKVKPLFTSTKPYFASTQETRTHFLFNDLLLFCSNPQGGKLIYKGQLDLNNCSIIDIEDDASDMPFCFQLITKTARGDVRHTVRTNTGEEKAEWMGKIDTAISALQNGIRMSYNVNGKRLIPIRQPPTPDKTSSLSVTSITNRRPSHASDMYISSDLQKLDTQGVMNVEQKNAKGVKQRLTIKTLRPQMSHDTLKPNSYS